MLVNKSPDCGKHYKELPMSRISGGSGSLEQENTEIIAMENKHREEVGIPKVAGSKNIKDNGEIFLVMFEVEKEHIGKLPNKVSEQIDIAAKRGIIRTYQYDEMYHKNWGCLLISLKLKGDGEKILRDILNEVEGISHIYIRPFDTCLVAFDEFMASKK